MQQLIASMRGGKTGGAKGGKKNLGPVGGQDLDKFLGHDEAEPAVPTEEQEAAEKEALDLLRELYGGSADPD